MVITLLELVVHEGGHKEIVFELDWEQKIYEVSHIQPMCLLAWHLVCGLQKNLSL